MRDGADTQFTDQTVDGATPGLFPSGPFNRVHTVEVGPVLAVDVELVRSCFIEHTVVFNILRQDNRLGAVENVVADGGHLVHVFGSGVDQWVVGIEVTLDYWVLPVAPERSRDRVCASVVPRSVS